MRLRHAVRCALLLAPLAAFSWSVGARVFDLKNATVAPYIRGTFGLSGLAQDEFANSDGSASVADRTHYQYGGELGVMFAVSNQFHVRLGAEVIQHGSLEKASGTDASGTPLFTLDTSVFVFNPCVTFEYVYNVSGSWRYYAALGGGYSNVTVVNSYKMTAAGTSAYSGVTDYDEKMEANVISGMAEMGVETLFTDNATFVAGLGYRYMPVTSLKYKGDVNTILAPSGVKKGDPVLNEDGTARKLNLGGLFASVGFRFYINFL